MKLKIYPSSSVFLSILIFIFLLSTPTLAQTLTPTEVLILQLQEQVKQLQSQIEQLRTELAITKSEVAIVKVELKFTKALSRGTTGDEVTKLQEFLKQFPDIYPQGLVTGYFGPLTEAAVRKFQEKQGIESIGVVGPKTLSKLNELITEGAGTSGVIPPGLLIAPGIQSKLATTTPLDSFASNGATTTPSVATTTPTAATTTPSGTTPATPATPATPTSVSGAPTVSATPAISATPAQPTANASTTPTPTTSILTISSISVSAVPESTIQDYATVTVNWTTNISADSEFEYTTTVFPGPSIENSLKVTSHSMVTMLKSSTTYKYRVKSGGVISDELTLTTPAPAAVYDKTPPVISNLRAENITTSSAQIKWTTDEDANGQVGWSTNSSLIPSKNSNIDCAANTNIYTFSTEHCIKSSGLSPGTTYYYKAHSGDKAGHNGFSNVQQFTTTADASTATSTSSLNTQSKNISAISQMLNSLDEMIKQLSKILK